MNGKKYDYVGEEIRIYFRSPYNTYRRQGLIYLKIKETVIIEWESTWLHSFASCGFSSVKYVSLFNKLTAFDLGYEMARDLVFTPQEDKVILSYYEDKEQIYQNKLYHDWEKFIVSVFDLISTEEPNILTHPFWGIINDDWPTYCKNIISYWKVIEDKGGDKEIILNQWFDSDYNYLECKYLNLLQKELLGY